MMTDNSEPAKAAEATKEAKKVTLQVNICTKSSATTEAFLIHVQGSDIGTPTLSTIRKAISDQPEQREYALCYFCTKTGAVVPDSWTTSEYFKVLKVNVDKAEVLDVYIKKKASKLRPEITLAETPSLKLTQLKDPLHAPKLEELKSRYDAQMWQADVGDSDKKHPAELQEKEWSIVAQNNDLCYGYNVLRQDIDGRVHATGLTRARLAAFQFKPRRIPAYRLPSGTAADTELSLRVPEFIVDDHAHVNVFETQNEFQSSMARSSFSEKEIQAAVGGSAFGVTIEVSGGYSDSSKDETASATMQSSRRLNFAYNFPRVTLMLDQDSLELTPHCRTALDTGNLEAIFEDYGQFFTAQVRLGGRLYASESVESSSQSEVTSMTRAMKASAAASFSGWGISASGSASGGNASTDSSSSASRSLSQAIAWDAHGGDTLLCNNPPAWCPTVASYHNWRVIQQDEVCPMWDMIVRCAAGIKKEKLLDIKKKFLLDIKNKKKFTPEDYFSAGRRPPGMRVAQIAGFKLRLKDKGGYLTAKPPTEEQNLAKLFSVLWKSTEIVPPEYDSIGVCVIGPQKGSVFCLETSAGESLTSTMKVHYNKPYRLKVLDTGAYVSKVCRWPHLMGYLTVSETLSPKTFIIFSESGEDHATSSVGAGTPVEISVSVQTPTKEEGDWMQFGAVNTVDGSGAGPDTFLIVEPDRKYDKPTVFTYEPVDTIEAY